MEDFMSAIVQNGFSVAVAAFLLVRMDRRLEELSQAIRDLHSAILNRGWEGLRENEPMVSAAPRGAPQSLRYGNKGGD